MDPAPDRARRALTPTIVHVFDGLPVTDLAAALAWYERVMGRPPDMRPHDQEATWQLADSASIYVVVDRERAGRGLLTVIVAELDRLLAELAGRGLTPVSTEGQRGELRRAVFTDPDGNRVTFGQLP